MNLPRISIIVPSFNQGNYLEETLLSIINQGYPNLELFVVDGGSTDNSVGIIKKYADKINWWVSEKDKGQAEAINKGLRKANGEIVNWINSDDLLVPGALQKIASLFSVPEENVGLIHGGAIVFDNIKKNETRFTYQAPSREAYFSGMVFPQPASFFLKKYLDKVGFINEEFQYGMDYDLFLRLSLVSEFLPANEVFAKYRLHKQSKSVADSNKFINDWKKSYVNLCKNLDWKYNLDYLLKTGLFENELNYYKPYIFQADDKIHNKIDSKKSLFFHLGHVLKDLYWNNNLTAAKNLKVMMRKDFENSWWREDPRLVVVAKKLRYPVFALNTLKAIKAIITKADITQ